MRFYAVCTEAIEHTHRALQQLEQRRQGSSRPSRALRVAQLYGHLQCRARDGAAVQLGLRDLAAAWHLQPRELRADLKDLQAIGWLHYSSGPAGLRIQLTEPAPVAAAASHLPETSAVEASNEAAQNLIDQFAACYNRQRPASWPAYSPRGSALAARLRRAIAHAGGPETFWPLLTQALAGMPEFWRTTYPQGRSGADCASVLFSADRHAAGLGVEFWHVFCWSGAPGIVAGGGVGADVGHAPGPQESDFRRACRLFAWGDHAWRGQGMEAFALPDSEKQRLTELLEAAGLGEHGQAARQFGQKTTA
ncbi:hypothetical protein [Vulcanococcus limneticus]|uniref:hypothetical protein n=1 Tax=Vulcanococcus limneticus TaxID=2170428 RepID=UPI00398C02A3